MVTSIARRYHSIEHALTRRILGLLKVGHHLPADTLTAMVRAKGPGRAFLVSDSVALAGSEPGRYHQPVGGDVELHASGRLTIADSPLLAGSGVNLAQVVAWTLTHTPLGLPTVRSAGCRPAPAPTWCCWTPRARSSTCCGRGCGRDHRRRRRA